MLKEMYEGENIKNYDIAELCRATYLSLRATKEIARAIGWPMAALVVTERHLWLTLSQINDKDRVFLLNDPILLSGLFGNAVSTVVDKFQKAKIQAAAFSDFSLAMLKVGPSGNCSPWGQFTSLGTSIREQTSCRDRGWGPGNGCSTMRWWSRFGRSSVEPRWTCLHLERPHIVPSGSLWLIQLKFGWMLWYRCGRGFICTRSPLLLCFREFWRAFAGTRFVYC